MRSGLAPALAAGLIVLSALASADATPQSSRKKGGPETFRARATVASAEGRADVYVTFHIEQYTPERDLQSMQQALKSGGSAAFLEAVRKAPVAGTFEAGEKRFTIRWARQQPTEKGRVISIVIDSPVYFVGAGLPDAKPRDGYDLAVAQLTMDSSGVGEGVMAAAARVKPGGPTGVEIDDYGTEPIKLLSVMLKIS